MESLKLNYSVSIKESFSEDGEFIIEGTAINATTTDNGHTFLVEELRPAADSLTGVPLLVDHDALVENIKGRVLIGEFNEADEKIDFKARVVDEKIQKLIKDGLLNTVSVGANVKEIQEGENGNLIARGIKFKELSLVATPADDNATFGIAMSEAYNSQSDNSQSDKSQSNDINETSHEESESEENLQDMKGGSENMNENNNEKILEAIESMGKTFSEKLDEKIEAVEKSFSEKLEALKESDADEAKAKADAEAKEEPKVEEPAKVEEPTVETPEEEEEDEDEKAEESTGLDIVEGNGSLRGNSFSYNW